MSDITTHWSLLEGLDDPARPDRDRRWETLLQRYRPALVDYARKVLSRLKGVPADRAEAEDAVQSFLAACVEGAWLRRADPQTTRSFRALLTTMLRRHIKDLMTKEHAKKRRPDGPLLSLEAAGIEPEVEDHTLEELFTRSFAERTVKLALEYLEGMNPRYACVIRQILGEDEPVPTTPWLRSRAKTQFRDAFLRVLAVTVRDADDLPDEWRTLAPWLP